MRWSSLLMVALLVGFSPDLADALVLLTSPNPSVFADYPAPILTSDIKPTPNTGFIILEFADSNFGAENQLEVQGFNTTDGSGLAYVDVLVNGPEDNLLIPAAVGHGPGGLGILLATGGPVNLLQFRVGYYDDVGREFETPAVALSAVPTPPTFPLFATGLALMGWLAWRRKSALV